MVYLSIVLGGALILFGRKAFWLFVGGVGFLAGLYVTPLILASQYEPLSWVVAIVLGVLGALLAHFLQRLGVFIAGFFAGGSIATWLAVTLGFAGDDPSVLIFILGGIIGAVLIAALFDWALIMLSSLAGSYLVVSNLTLDTFTKVLAFIAMVVIGLVFQNILKKKE
jgi:uncharacterized membrane protein YeaQ/YmgE (transglycosylase-associated protein family)